jgi:hypothetical protein
MTEVLAPFIYIELTDRSSLSQTTDLNASLSYTGNKYEVKMTFDIMIMHEFWENDFLV